MVMITLLHLVPIGCWHTETKDNIIMRPLAAQKIVGIVISQADFNLEY